jgi:hypothetical protein
MDFPPKRSAASPKRPWLWIVACGFGSAAVGISLSWGHGEGGTIGLTIGAGECGIVVARW